MNSTDIKKRLFQCFINYNYKLFNSFVFDWECDFFAISKTGYSIEIEIKISKADFKADYKKEYYGKNKHHQLLDKNDTDKPNKFYFACPDGLIKTEDINENYGLIYITDSHWKIVREAKFLHKNKMMTEIKYVRKLLDKFYHRNIELRNYQHNIDWDIKYGQIRIYPYDYF